MAQATYDWDRAYVKQDEFGNGTFGAGYSAGLTFSSRAGRGNGRDSFTGEGLLSGYVTDYGTDHEVARISGKASMTGSQGTSSYYVRLMMLELLGEMHGIQQEAASLPAAPTPTPVELRKALMQVATASSPAVQPRIPAAPRPSPASPTSSGPRYCSQCGAEVNDAARFCGSCGARL